MELNSCGIPATISYDCFHIWNREGAIQTQMPGEVKTPHREEKQLIWNQLAWWAESVEKWPV